MATTKREVNGKLLIEEEEGAVETRFSPTQDVKAFGDLTSVWDTNVGDFVEGQVIVSGVLRASTDAAHDWSAIEVQLVGYLGPIPTILQRAYLGGARNVIRWPLEQGNSYDRIGLEACPVVNGVRGPSAALQPVEATLSAALKLWR